MQDSILKTSAKRYVEARQALHELLAKNPEDLRALRVLVGSYAAQNQLKAAVAEVRDYAAKHSNSAGVQYFWGNLLLETGESRPSQTGTGRRQGAGSRLRAADLSLARIDLLQANWKDARSQLTTILSNKGENPLSSSMVGYAGGVFR